MDDTLALNNPDFSKYTDQIYPAELALYKSNSSSDHAPFLGLDLTVYDKRNDFSFPIVNFARLDGDVL